MNKKKNFFVKYEEQILNIAIILATTFLILVWTGCKRKTHVSLSDKCIVLYNGRYDIIFVEDDSLYFFVPATSSLDEHEVKVYKKDGTKKVEISDLNIEEHE